MDYEIYHDESQISGFWHGMILIPIARKKEIIDLLVLARKNIGYPYPLSLKNIKRPGKILDCSQSWFSIAVAAMRSKTKGEPVGIYIGEKDRGKRKYRVAGELTGLKFILFRSRKDHTDMSGHKDHASKVETTFRMGLKGGLHFLGDAEDPINISKIHFDGYEHLKRHIDAERIVGRIAGLREYCTIAHRDDLVDDRTSDHRELNASQPYGDCQLLQLADIMVGSFRTILGKSTNKIHTKLAYPARYLIERYSKGFARMQNSRWKDSFCMSECYLENGQWVFKRLDIEKEEEINQPFLPGLE